MCARDVRLVCQAGVFWVRFASLRPRKNLAFIIWSTVIVLISEDRDPEKVYVEVTIASIVECAKFEFDG